jgi:hypothetical protein
VAVHTHWCRNVFGRASVSSHQCNINSGTPFQKEKMNQEHNKTTSRSPGPHGRTTRLGQSHQKKKKSRTHSVSQVNDPDYGCSPLRGLGHMSSTSIPITSSLRLPALYVHLHRVFLWQHKNNGRAHYKKTTNFQRLK